MRLNYILSVCCLLNFFSLSAQTDPCNKGLEEYQQYRFHEAVKLLDNCYLADSNNLEILAKTAYCHYKLGSYKEAEDDYLALLHRDSTDIQARNQLASIYVRLDQNEQALQQYSILISQDSANPYYFKQLGMLHNKEGELIDAHEAMVKALELNPADLAVINFLSNLYLNTYKFDAAGRMLIRGLKVDPQYLPLLHTQMKLFQKTKSWEEALLTTNRLLQLGDSSVQVMKIAGLANYHLQIYPLAIYFLQETLKKSESTEVLHYYLGMAYQNIEEYEKSMTHFELAIDHGISDYLPIYYQSAAKSYEEAGEYSKAIAAYKIAYDNTGDKLILYQLARVYDIFYTDKSPAQKYYEQYVASNDTLHEEQMEYARDRLSEMKKVEHFRTDTMN